MIISGDLCSMSSRSVNERKPKLGMHMHEKVQFNWVNYFSIDWVLLNRVLEMNFSWQMFRAMIQSVFLSASHMPPAWVESSSIDRFSMQRMKLVSSTIKCQLDWHSARYLAARDVSEPGEATMFIPLRDMQGKNGNLYPSSSAIWNLRSNWPVLLHHWILLVFSWVLETCMSIEERTLKVRPHEMKKWKSGRSMHGILIR